MSQASKAMTWFHLGTGRVVQGNNARYLHPGRESDGCVTVTDVRYWDRLYEALILAREAGERTIGTIRIEP